MSVTTSQNDRVAWLKGPGHTCSVMPAASKKTWRLILLGAPGVGKGTQAKLICARFGACHLSTGDVFRAAKSLPSSDRSPAMTSALGFMSKGDLVPDTTVLDLVRERLACLQCQGGFLLDGFPRTVPQAQALHDLLQSHLINIDAVLDYQLPLNQIVARLSGRRTCSHCKAVYHTESRPSQRPGLCDECGNKLIQREDDRPETVRNRMEVYHTSTAPLTDYFKKLHILRSIPADGTPDQIFERTLKALKAS